MKVYIPSWISLALTLTMGHQINGLLATSKYLNLLAQTLGLPQPKRLRQNLGFVPLNDVDLDRIFAEPGCYHSEFIYLSAALVSLLLEHSKEQPIAYIETDYFGGIGHQSAVLAQNGKLGFGPVHGPNSINRVLQMLGIVKSEPDGDEFDAVGLGWLRSNDTPDVPIDL